MKVLDVIFRTSVSTTSVPYSPRWLLCKNLAVVYELTSPVFHLLLLPSSSFFFPSIPHSHLFLSSFTYPIHHVHRLRFCPISQKDAQNHWNERPIFQPLWSCNRGDHLRDSRSSSRRPLFSKILLSRLQVLLRRRIAPPEISKATSFRPDSKYIPSLPFHFETWPFPLPTCGGFFSDFSIECLENDAAFHRFVSV